MNGKSRFLFSKPPHGRMCVWTIFFSDPAVSISLGSKSLNKWVTEAEIGGILYHQPPSLTG